MTSPAATRRHHLITSAAILALAGAVFWFGRQDTHRPASSRPATPDAARSAVPRAASTLTPAEQEAIASARPCDHTVLTRLDLSRPPTEAELIAAGNLGEPLTPTASADASSVVDPGKRKLLEAQNLAFGTAIQAWNAHDYEEAVELFEEYLSQFPGSPWAAECELHLGCYCQYKGRYLEAANHFDTILEDAPPASSMFHKAKLRRSILFVDQGLFDEAEQAFGQMYQDDPDADHKTYASYWLRQIGLLRRHETALRDCGQKTLAHACEIMGMNKEAAEFRAMSAAGPHGFTARELLNTALLKGLDPRPVLASGALDELPVPFVAHYNDRHFVTVEAISGEEVRLFDTRVGSSHAIPVDSFRLQWSGFAMLFEDAPPLAAIAPADNLDSLVGGCCGFPRQISDLGDDPCAKKNCGMPGWSVNLLNMNFRVQDTPMWWDPPYGPPVDMSLLFNSLDSLNNLEPFGPKWAFTYASYLLIDPSESVTVRDGDGRFEVFNLSGGSFVAPPHDRRNLVKNGTGDYDLIHPDGTVYHYGIAGLMEGTTDVPLLLSITDRHGNSITIEHNSNGAIAAVKHSALGPDDKWTFHYKLGISPSRVERIVDPFGRVCYFYYDNDHRLKSQKDMGGIEYSYTYTIKPAESQYLDEQTNSYPVTDELFIDTIGTPKGTTSIVTEPADGIERDPMTDPDVGYPPYGEHMWANYRIRVTDPENKMQEFHYDGATATIFTRDGAQVAAATVSNPSTPWRWTGPKAEYEFDSHPVTQRARIIEATSLSPTDGYEPLMQIVSFDDTVDLPTEIIGATGVSTWRSYNSKGRLTSFRQEDINGYEDVEHQFSLHYKANNIDLESIKRKLGGVERTLLNISYHANRDPHVLTDVLGRTLTYTWHTNGLPNTITVSPSGEVITFDYDTNWRPSGIKINNQTVLTTGYDLEGRLRSVLDAAGYFVSFDYDDLNRLTREDHPDDSFIERIWECCFMSELRSGKMVSGADRVLERTLIRHDGRGLPTRETDTAGRVTRFAYDEAGRLVTLTDARDQTTTWSYDDHGRLVKKTYPDLSEEETVWTNAEQIDHTINRRGNYVYFAYHPHGQIQEVAADELNTFYSYDAWDRIDYIDHTPNGQSTPDRHDFTHDLLGRITSIDGPWTDDTISWSYNDTLRKVTRTTPGNIVTETVADAFGRIATVQDPLGLFTFAYTDQLPKPDGITHTQGNANGTPYSGFDTIFTWHGDDQRRALESITHKRPGGDTIAKHTYGYDDLGRITSWKREAQLANPSGPTREYEWSIHHDLASQLSSVIEKSLGGTLQGAWHYGYDPAGNITTAQAHTDASSPASISRRSHNSLNQIETMGGGGATLVRGVLNEPGIVSVGRAGGPSKTARMLDGYRFEAEVVLEPDASGSDVLVVQAADSSGNVTTESFEVEVDEPDEVALTYDDDGNLLDDDGTSPAKYEWDSLSRLTKVTWAAGKTTEFRYNALGQRVERIETDGSTVTNHYYFYDGIALVDRRTGSSASADRRYFAQGEQRLSGSAWENYHYGRDHLGSVREVVKWNGTLVARYDFGPFGQRQSQYEASAYGGQCDLGFTGHVVASSLVAADGELVLAMFRIYDPRLGCWLSQDQLGELGPDGANLYTYVSNCPVEILDPTGMWGIQFGDFNIGIGNPTLHFTNDSWGDLADGAMATADGFIPFADPFAASGNYDPCGTGIGFSRAMGGWSRDAAVAAATGGAGLARGGTARILAGGKNASGIYQFPTAAGNYVGQSGNIGVRLGQHGQRVAGSVQRWKVGGGNLQREIAEQARINRLGGISNLANKVNPIGPARQHLYNPKMAAETAAALGASASGAAHAADGGANGGCE